jgi:hypothetical protein
MFYSLFARNRKKTRGLDQISASPIQPEIEIFENTPPYACCRQTKKANASALMDARIPHPTAPTFQIENSGDDRTGSKRSDDSKVPAAASHAQQTFR